MARAWRLALDTFDLAESAHIELSGPSVRLFVECFHEGVRGVAVEDERHFRCYLVADVKELAAGRHWEQEGCCSFLHRVLGELRCVEDRLDAAAERAETDREGREIPATGTLGGGPAPLTTPPAPGPWRDKISHSRRLLRQSCARYPCTKSRSTRTAGRPGS